MLRIITCSSFMLFASAALANGYVVPYSTHDYYIDLKKADIKNEVGFVTNAFTWDLGQNYGGTVTCPSQSIYNAPFYYKAIMSNGLTPSSDGYVKLNDFLDMKVEIWIDGRRREYVRAPFNNESNFNTSNNCRQGQQVQENNFRSGSKGRIYFRVKKQIINGVQISDRQVVEMFGRMGNTVSDFNNIPMSRITITSAILYVPEECVINGGQTIEVEFGDIPGSGLDGNNFEKTVPLTFQCKGGAFEGDALKINLGISGRPASFSQDYLRTTSDSYTGNKVIPDLGIKFKQLDGSPLQLNKFYPVSMQGNIGDWGFIAAPVTPTGADIPAGDFYATATIVAEFQ
ncbi:fimbrial protein [Aeromonas jandaei]|uniref:fimbrial protein n=1 Tax=Aeromonas veronii TaxID=654 RepID=UPI00162979C4|nr:fimbrial protein [Aeromonas jandaei]